VVDAAAAVSAPLDLAAANLALSSGFNLVYARHFLRTLVPAAREKDRRFPGRIDMARALAARTMRDFDDAVTAPLHGFHGADDYYARSSAGTAAGDDRDAALLLHAANDPFLPRSGIAPRRQVARRGDARNPSARRPCRLRARPAAPGRIDWLPQRLLAHFAAHLPS
jgi:predicted alpha/beta-fold hydrolase